VDGRLSPGKDVKRTLTVDEAMVDCNHSVWLRMTQIKKWKLGIAERMSGYRERVNQKLFASKWLVPLR
jgi:hypothetical protein